MENQVLSHTTDELIPGLTYTLGKTAQFVRSRQATTFWPSGGNQYSVSGVRCLRFEIQSGGDMFLDPSTLRLAFKLKNNDAANPLRLLSNSPLCLFQRLRVLMKGTLVEDINYLHRMETMFDVLLPPQRRKTQSLQMMGDTEEDRFYETEDVYNEPVKRASSRKVMCPILSGLLSSSQPLWIPLKMAPLTIELEINPLVQQYLVTNVEGRAATVSTDWSLEDAMIKVDLCEVDVFLADKIYQSIRTGGLQFSFASVNTTMNVLPAVSAVNGQISTQFAKSYSRIKSIFVTFGTAEFNGPYEKDKLHNETFFSVACSERWNWCRSLRRLSGRRGYR